MHWDHQPPTSQTSWQVDVWAGLQLSIKLKALCFQWLWITHAADGYGWGSGGGGGAGLQGIQGHQPAAQGRHWAVSGPASGKDMRSWWGWRVDNGRRELTGGQSITWRGWSYTLYRASAQGCLTHILFLFFFYLLRLKESSSLTEHTVTGLQPFPTHLTLLLLLGCLSAWRMPDRWAWRQKKTCLVGQSIYLVLNREELSWQTEKKIEFPDLFRGITVPGLQHCS